MGPQGEPGRVYGERLAARREAAARWRRRDYVLSGVRLATFLIILGVAGFVLFGEPPAAGGWLVPPVALFVGLVFYHNEISQRRARADRGVAHYEWGLARLEDRWMGMGVAGEEYRERHHPYVEDLDLFGRGSLFELLCTARSRAGEERLAGWLALPAPPDEVRQRQAAVRELTGALDLREELAVVAEATRGGVDARRLAAWGEEPPGLHRPVLRVTAAVLVALTLTGALGWWLLDWGLMPLLLAVALEGGFALVLRSRVAAVTHACEEPCRELAVLGRMLARLERESFSSPRLAALQQALGREKESPSRIIAALKRRVELLESAHNQLFAAISPFLLWSTQTAMALEAWRARYGRRLRDWVAAAGEMEALLALAAYAFEHPDDPFPQLSDRQEFVAQQAGHPLLPRDRCVRNDVRLDETTRLLIVSGSNMSGKSTLLRTVGTNAVLALCGAPVRAESLRIGPLRLGASIRVLDSLQEGTSRFYAEISRLQQVVTLATDNTGVLFLLDEILHGTNSHDRRIGTEAVLRTLLTQGACGIITTHDLALAEIADRVEGAVNVHFSDQVAQGRMVFDYRMRPGVVQKSNALELMRAVGLRVDG